MHLNRDEVFPFLKFIRVEIVRQKAGVARAQCRRLRRDLTLRQIKPQNLVPVDVHHCTVIALQQQLQRIEPARIVHHDRPAKPGGDVFVAGVVAKTDSRCLVALAVAKLRRPLEPKGVIKFTVDPVFTRRLAGIEITPSAALCDQHRLVRPPPRHHLKLNPGRLHRLPVGALCRRGDHEFTHPPVLPLENKRLRVVGELHLAINRELDLLNRLATKICLGLDLRYAGGLDAKFRRCSDPHPRLVIHRLRKAKRHRDKPGGKPGAMSNSPTQNGFEKEKTMTICRLAKRASGSPVNGRSLSL